MRVLASPTKIDKRVPANTVIFFLAEPGYCLNIPSTLGIQNEFFTSKDKLYNFLYRAGNAVNKKRNVNINYVHNIDTRIKVPGDKYLDMHVIIQPDKKWPTMGYVKKLPTKPSHEIPLIKNVVALPAGDYLLSELLETRFKRGGVFIISSCRAIPNNITRFKNANLKMQPARKTAWTAAITTGENYIRRIHGRVAKPTKIQLAPIIKRNSTRNIYPPRTLRNIRTAVSVGGKNFITALINLKARANLESRKPKEYALLKRQPHLQTLPLNKIMKLRSGWRLASVTKPR